MLISKLTILALTAVNLTSIDTSTIINNTEAVQYSGLNTKNAISQFIEKIEQEEISKKALTEALEKQKELDEIRAKKIDNYFSKRNAPLAGYGKKFIEESKKCNMDWRLIAAIGTKESSGGKHMMNNNPFGWGSAKIPFKDFNEAIEVVTWNLCGENPNTAKYYKTEDIEKKLWYYNTSVVSTYTDDIYFIMDLIDRTEA
jgi:hypothetical protein